MVWIREELQDKKLHYPPNITVGGITRIMRSFVISEISSRINLICVGLSEEVMGYGG